MSLKGKNLQYTIQRKVAFRLPEEKYIHLFYIEKVRVSVPKVGMKILSKQVDDGKTYNRTELEKDGKVQPYSHPLLTTLLCIRLIPWQQTGLSSAYIIYSAYLLHNYSFLIPVINWLSGAEVVDDVFSGCCCQGLKCPELVLCDSEWVLENYPVDGLFTPTCGERPAVVEVFVHQDRQEVDNIHIPCGKLQPLLKTTYINYSHLQFKLMLVKF